MCKCLINTLFHYISISNILICYTILFRDLSRVAACPCFRYLATSSQTAKVARDTGSLPRANLRVPVSDTSLHHPIICTSAKVVQVPCPGRVNLRVPVSDTSLHHHASRASGSHAS